MNPLKEFLTSRRARIEPGDVGLPPSTTPRRSKGLRREEVAILAGVSVDYYTRLEQGRVGNVSDQVLVAVENALRLDPLERDHFRTLITPAPARPRRDPAPRAGARPALRRMVDVLDPVPALLQGPRMEILAINGAAKALLADFGAMPVADRNIARWVFLDPRAKVVFPEWDMIAADIVAALRRNLNPRRADEALNRVVGELTCASPEFSRLWADYKLFQHGHGRKKFFNELVGTLTLNYETFHPPGGEGQALSIYTADAGSPDQDKLDLLVNWAGVQAGRA
ncbi:helix-turn-helix transcriptional regulator [Herbidospora sp. RD11066]